MKDKMQYRPLGKSGIDASVLGFGAFAVGGWFYGGTDERDSVDAIRAGIDEGINLIDTAPIYGYGLSEEIVGKAVQGRRSDVIIATKTGLVWEGEEGEFFTYADDMWPTDTPSKYSVYKNLKPHSIRREVEDSLRRLGTDYIDLYQTHWQDSTTPIEETMETLLALRQQGKIRAIGVSNINVEQLKEYGDEIVSAQEKFSLLDRGIEENGIVDYCVEHSISILSYFTLEQGLLTGKLSPEREFPEGDMRKSDPKFSVENRRKVQEALKDFEGLASKYECSIVQLIIALTAAQKGITHLLVGARNARQARENARGGAIVLEPEDAEFMNARLKPLTM